ncbi:diguanylate cyclase, partial [Nitrosomonas sp.]
MTTDCFNILLADDDATIRYLMQIALEQAGFNVTVAQNGDEAIRLFSVSQPDMVLLDVDMPGKNGYEVCSYLRKKAGSEFPIVMVTGMDDVRSIDHAFDLGATDFIVKPINWNLIPYHILYLKRAYLNLIDLKHANVRSRAIFNAIPDAMFILNTDGVVIEVLSHPSKISCLTINTGKKLSQSFPKHIVKKYLNAGILARKQQKIEHFEFQLKFDAQNTRYYECRIVTIDSNETLCLIQDTTDHVNSENKIYRLAYFDALTGLPNRHSFMKRLKREITRTSFTSHKLAILFLDLDGFKCINDAMGHNTGDRMLQSAASRLQQSMRTSDFLAFNPQNDTNKPKAELARIGGDEFTIIFSNLERTEDALAMAHRIRETMQQPFQIDNRDVVLTTSVGIALYPDDGADAETLLKHADTAMNHAKNEGRNNCQFYSST